MAENCSNDILVQILDPILAIIVEEIILEKSRESVSASLSFASTCLACADRHRREMIQKRFEHHAPDRDLCGVGSFVYGKLTHGPVISSIYMSDDDGGDCLRRLTITIREYGVASGVDVSFRLCDKIHFSTRSSVRGASVVMKTQLKNPVTGYDDFIKLVRNFDTICYEEELFNYSDDKSYKGPTGCYYNNLPYVHGRKSKTARSHQVSKIMETRSAIRRILDVAQI